VRPDWERGEATLGHPRSTGNRACRDRLPRSSYLHEFVAAPTLGTRPRELLYYLEMCPCDESGSDTELQIVSSQSIKKLYTAPRADCATWQPGICQMGRFVRRPGGRPRKKLK